MRKIKKKKVFLISFIIAIIFSLILIFISKYLILKYIENNLNSYIDSNSFDVFEITNSQDINAILKEYIFFKREVNSVVSMNTLKIIEYNDKNKDNIKKEIYVNYDYQKEDGNFDGTFIVDYEENREYINKDYVLDFDFNNLIDINIEKLSKFSLLKDKSYFARKDGNNILVISFKDGFGIILDISNKNIILNKEDDNKIYIIDYSKDLSEYDVSIKDTSFTKDQIDNLN